MQQLTQRGRRAYFAGAAAEMQVAAEYERQGYQICETRWRGPGGEVDLIVRKAEEVTFVEVKQARTHAAAAERINARQQARILSAAASYHDQKLENRLIDMRFDAALVDGGGVIHILENAFGEC